MSLTLFFICALLGFVASAETPKECKEAGPLCETCSSLVVCVKNEDSWTKTPLAKCKPPAFCEDGVCTTRFNPFCSDVASWSFPCQDVGVFPDPFYCNKYHFCVKEDSGLQGYSATCESGFGFNIADVQCSNKLENGDCPTNPDQFPVPFCLNTTNSDFPLIGAIPEKPAMYYICESRTVDSVSAMYPYLRLCKGDGIFANYTCKSPQD